MDDEIILNDCNPSEDTLRRWAFDDNILLIDQDEDLILGRRDYFAILIPLADDPTCPKADYILSSLDFHLMFVILRGTEFHLREVPEAIQLARAGKQRKLHEWAALQERRLAYRQGNGPVNREKALSMGQELLNGICRQAEISISSESSDTWTVQLSVPPSHHHREYLVINKQDGQFAFSRYRQTYRTVVRTRLGADN
ncbi:hypothetical protein [Collimonas pratensis]|uniref:hypothetical protein n=1 Tax=Collimonas pratensis TaxID=279113 RepID=UPI000782831E|nr:hypothetical protein [Collimonas pratensis]